MRGRRRAARFAGFLVGSLPQISLCKSGRLCIGSPLDAPVGPAIPALSLMTRCRSCPGQAARSTESLCHSAALRVSALPARRGTRVALCLCQFGLPGIEVNSDEANDLCRMRGNAHDGYLGEQERTRLLSIVHSAACRHQGAPAQSLEAETAPKQGRLSVATAWSPPGHSDTDNRAMIARIERHAGLLHVPSCS